MHSPRGRQSPPAPVRSTHTHLCSSCWVPLPQTHHCLCQAEPLHLLFPVSASSLCSIGQSPSRTSPNDKFSIIPFLTPDQVSCSHQPWFLDLVSITWAQPSAPSMSILGTGPTVSPEPSHCLAPLTGKQPSEDCVALCKCCHLCVLPTQLS